MSFQPLHATISCLTSDEVKSPWSTLRQDETSREEIFQDVTRCMQDNYFFREPATQKRLLDILFIYAKLNPDIGYRQGMHELVAPILWVIHQEAVDLTGVPEVDRNAEGTEFMVEVLDSKFIEHDAFNLFCAVMQTAKAFYEVGESRDSAPIIARSNRIHDEMLDAVDPDLALHLHVIGILPQIYSM
jgi:TBC1 domain family member 5